MVAVYPEGYNFTAITRTKELIIKEILIASLLLLEFLEKMENF